MIRNIILWSVFLWLVISAMKDSDKVKRSDIYFIIYIGFLNICDVIEYIVFKLEYNEITSTIILYTGITIVIVGIFQLITNKINYKLLGGRVLGIILIASTLGLVGINNSNEENKIIGTMLNNNKKEVNEFKRDYNNEKKDKVALAKVELENREYYNTLDKEVVDNSTYYYDSPNSKESIVVVSTTIKELDPRIKEMLKVDENNKTEITILTSFAPLNINDITIEGFVNKFDNVVNIKSLHSFKNMYSSENLSEEVKDYFNSLEDKDSIKNYKSIIIHEYTHKLTNDLIDNNKLNRFDVPIWFYEGIGILSLVMYEGEEENLKGKLNKEIDLRDSSGFHGVNSNEYYKQSGIIIKNIVDEYGLNVINDILKNISHDTDIYSSIEKVTGKSLKELGI